MSGLVNKAATVAGGALGTMILPGVGTMIGSGLGNMAGKVATGQGPGQGLGGLVMGGVTSGLSAGLGGMGGDIAKTGGAAVSAAKQAGGLAANQIKNSFGSDIVKGLGLNTTQGKINFGLETIGNLMQGPAVPTDGNPVDVGPGIGKFQPMPLMQTVRNRSPYI